MDEDIALLKSSGATAYRFSISWSRMIPLGGRSDPVNEAGIAFYVRYVDALLAAGITPFVTLFHWDLPQGLHDRYLGMLNKGEFQQDFEHYARLCFERLPKVKHWITLNEPWCSSVLGYNTGLFAPGRCSDRTKSTEGDSSREHLVAAHSLLLAHGAAVKAYREDFKPRDKGVIGITLNGLSLPTPSLPFSTPMGVCVCHTECRLVGDWTEPWDPADPEDVAACERKLEFAISWFADPVYFGKYPDSMRKQLGDRLPEFTPSEAALLKGSNDFYGMNHYTANYVKHKATPAEADDHLGNLETLFVNKAGDCIGPETQSVWLRPHPQGFRKLLGWLDARYGKPVIYVTENGTSLKGENDLPREVMVNDDFRANYFRGYIDAMVKARVEDGVDVRGYLAWSLLEYVSFLWGGGACVGYESMTNLAGFVQQF